MKLQATKKQIQRNYNTIIRVGYCDLQYLLYYSSAFAYSAGQCGWSCDYYAFDPVCISTGYNSIGDVRPARETIKRYEDQARAIVLGDGQHAQKERKVKKLIEKFLAEVTI